MKTNQARNLNPEIRSAPSTWVRYWYILLLLYVAAVLFSVYVRHNLAVQYEQAVLKSQDWSERFRHYARLGRLMTGVDVFESENSTREHLAKTAAQIEEIRNEFERVFIQDKRDLTARSQEEKAEVMLKDLELVRLGMDDLIQNTTKLINHPQVGGTAQVDELPHMVASFRKVLRTFGRLRSRVAGVEDEYFQEQIQAVHMLERVEYAIAFLLFSLVGGVTYYGNRLEWQAGKDLKEKELLLTQVQEADGKYRALFENASEGIFQIDSHGSFIIANPAMAKMCGYSSPAELIESISDVGVQFYADPLFWDQFLHDVRNKKAVSSWETEVQCRNGNLIWVEQNLHAVEEAPGKIGYFEGTLKNITEQKWEELRRTLDYLLPRILAESASVAEAQPGVLQTLCEILDWEMGVGWRVDCPPPSKTANVMKEPESAAGWLILSHINETGLLQNDDALEPNIKIPVGENFLGNFHETASVSWCNDITRLTSQGRGAAAGGGRLPGGLASDSPDICYAGRKGLETLVSLPVKVDGAVTHILNFFSSKNHEPTSELLKLLASVGSQLGHLFELKKGEEALKESEALRAAIFESSLDCMVTFDEEGLITDFNPAAERAFGYPREKAIGKEIGRIIVSSTFREIAPRGGNLGGEGENSDLMLGRRVELSALRGDRTEFPVEMSVSQISHNGRSFFTAYIREISDRKRAERVRSELAAVVEASNDAIIGLSPDGNILSWNNGAEMMFGFGAQEVIGRHIYVLVPPDRIEESARNLQALRQGNHLANYNTVRLRKGGRRIDVALTESPIRNNSGAIAGISLIARDITENKLLQEQLLQSQKMEAVGTLAGGIAHDFNNILTAIIGYSDLTLRQIHDQHPFYKNILGIKSSAEFAASLTHQLLAFSRRQTLELSIFPINDSVTKIEKLVHRLIGENINIITSLSSEAGRIRADQGQMEQVIMNLAVNARDAMPKGGVLTLETGNFRVEDADLLTGLVEGNYVKLSVSDTGHGMTDEVKERLFEPFFTTKDKGKGTGLGLATCYGIVRQIGGHILVESTPGEGTTFNLFFPQVEDSEQIFISTPAPAQTGFLPKGTETVLLVEDEETVRQLSADVLRRLGYQVLEAGDCASARAIIEDHNGGIDLLLSDVVLPNSSGKELADWAGAVHKEIKILLMSGYLEDSMLNNHGLRPDDAFLQKPFSPGILAQKVREVIDSPRRA